MKKSIAVILLCAVVCIFLTGCGTIKGFGDDLATVGRWITNSSEGVTQKK